MRTKSRPGHIRLRPGRVFFLEIVKSPQAVTRRQAGFRYKLRFISNVSDFFSGILLDVWGAATSIRVPATCSPTPATTATTGRLPRTLTAAAPTGSTSTAPATSIRPTTTISSVATPFAAFTLPDLRPTTNQIGRNTLGYNLFLAWRNPSRNPIMIPGHQLYICACNAVSDSAFQSRFYFLGCYDAAIFCR